MIKIPMKNILAALLILTCTCSKGQYYYHDILYPAAMAREMRSYMANKVSTITATGYTPEGVMSTDYAEVKKVMDNGKTLKTSLTNNLKHTVTWYRFDVQGRLLSIADTTASLQNLTSYAYDANGRIISVQNNQADTASDFNQTEMHNWIYGADGKLSEMIRTVNGSDSLVVMFTHDEKGNIMDETSLRRGVKDEVVYYYYDEKGRMTDIVRFNKKYNRLLPDETFDYDEKDNMIQKMTTTSSLNLGYLIWRYIFNDKGLKTKEALFDKKKELTGKIEYTYTFNN